MLSSFFSSATLATIRKWPAPHGSSRTTAIRFKLKYDPVVVVANPPCACDFVRIATVAMVDADLSWDEKHRNRSRAT